MVSLEKQESRSSSYFKGQTSERGKTGVLVSRSRSYHFIAISFIRLTIYFLAFSPIHDLFSFFLSGFLNVKTDVIDLSINLLCSLFDFFF